MIVPRRIIEVPAMVTTRSKTISMAPLAKRDLASEISHLFCGLKMRMSGGINLDGTQDGRLLVLEPLNATRVRPFEVLVSGSGQLLLLCLANEVLYITKEFNW